MTLGEYLQRTAQTPWAWDGSADCCTFTADWCVAVGYPDPMAFIRGSYASEAEALARVRRAGLLRLAQRGYKSIGLVRTLAPRCGDVAVLRRPTVEGDDVVCAIRSSDRWVTRLERGISVDEGGTLLRAWRVNWAKL